MVRQSHVLIAVAVCAVAAAGEDTWPPAKYANVLAEEPRSELDGEIRNLIRDYETRIAKLKQDDPMVQMNIPRLRDNILLLYMEYNKDKSRYRSDHFDAKECIDYLRGDMKFFLEDSLEKGKDPFSWLQARWSGKAYWIEGLDIMGRYDCVVAKDYDPAKKWPVIFSFQDSPDLPQLRTVPYFLIRNIQKGYPKGFVELECKVRSLFKDAAWDFNIDPFRIYATGFSFGGHTDLVEAWRHPHWFAAIAPVCNDLRGGEAPLVKHILNTPTYLLHGTGDSFFQTGKQIYEWMKEAGANVKWETYPGGHDPKVPFYENIKMLTDFFDQYTLDPYPKMVHHVIEHKRYSRAFWVDAKLVQDAGNLQAVFDVKVKDGNLIEIAVTDDIAELDFYLTDKLVDMTKPLAVVIGDKELYRGPAQGKVTVKIRDGQDYWRGAQTLLWEEIADIRKTAKP